MHFNQLADDSSQPNKQQIAIWYEHLHLPNHNSYIIHITIKRITIILVVCKLHVM